MNKQPDSESIVHERLDELADIPPRNPQAASRARARFLAQAISADEFQRQKGWKSIFRKERFAMNLLISVLVLASLFVAGGTTVAAAQDDLPNQPLYTIKTLSEDLSLHFEGDPEAKVDQLMGLAQIRLQEMDQLIGSDQTPPDQVRLRLEQHLQQALQLCSNMDDAALDQTLLQVREQLRQQDRDMERLQTHAAQDTQPILERTRTMLQTQLHLIDDGLQNHEMFRNTVRNGFQSGQTPPTSAPSLTPPAPNGQQNGQSTPQAGPDNGNGPGPNSDRNAPDATAEPGYNGNGSGSGNNPGNDNDSGGNNNSDSGGNGPGGGGSGGSGSGGKKP